MLSEISHILPEFQDPTPRKDTVKKFAYRKYLTLLFMMKIIDFNKSTDFHRTQTKIHINHNSALLQQVASGNLGNACYSNLETTFLAN